MALTWTKTAVEMDGNSKIVLTPNSRRRSFTIMNKRGNDEVAYDFTGEPVTMDDGIVLRETEWDRRDGDDAPRGAVTCIGTSGQFVIVWEGLSL